MTELSSAIEAFVSPMFADWRIEKSPGKLEDFDPLTLIQSFIECEIPFPDAMKLFDLVTERLKEEKYHLRASDSEVVFTYELIRAAVINELLHYHSETAPYWLANYDAAFGVVSTRKRDDGYVEARNAAEVRQVIEDVLGAKDERHQLPKASRLIIVERILKYIRYCGFYRIEKKFLEEFIRAICFDSSKAILLGGNFEKADVLATLEKSEEMIFQLREMDTASQLNIISLISENVSRALLNWLGHITAPSALRSRNQLKSLMIEAERHVSQPEDDDMQLSSVVGAAVKLFELTSHTPKALSDLLADILNSCEHEYLRQATTQTLDLIRFVRSLVREDFDVKILEDADIFDGSSYAEALSDVLVQQSIQHERRTNSVEIRADSSFHTILSLARTLTVVADQTRLDNENFDASWIEGAADDTVLVIVTEKPIGGSFIENIGKAALEAQFPMVPIRRTLFENTLSGGRDIRDLVQRHVAELFPFMLTWEVSPFSTAQKELPKDIKERERRLLETFNSDISKGRASAVCREVSVFFETKLRIYTQLIDDLIRNSPKSTTLRSLDRPGSGGIGDQIYYLRQVTQSGAPRAFKQLVVKDSALRVLEKIRSRRNRFLHHDIAIDEDFAYDYVHQIAVACASMNSASKLVTKVISFPFEGKVVTFDYLGFVDAVVDQALWRREAEEKRDKAMVRQANLAVLGYRIGDDLKSTFIANAACPICSTVTLQFASSGKTHCPGRCNGFTPIGGEWGSVIKKAEIAKKGETTMASSDEKQGVKNWLRPLGEGVATALGPFGAPLKVYLNKLDRDDAEELERHVLELGERIEQAEIRTVLRAQLDNSVGDALVDEVSYWVFEKVGDADRRSRIVRFAPFSGSRYLENQIVEELVLLYENKEELFWSDVSGSGIATTRIRKSGVLEADARDLVVSMRGQTPQAVLNFVSEISAKNPGSGVFAAARENIKRLIEISNS